MYAKNRFRTTLLLGIVAIVTALWLAACGNDISSVASDVDPQEAAALQAALDKAVADCFVPGAIMAVRTPEGKVWKGASGTSEYERGIPMDTAMHLHIGSVTKTFTATAVLMLIDRDTPIGEGKTLQLNTTVKEVLPELHLYDEENITLTDLLNMRSGLSDYSTLSTQWDLTFETDPGRVWLPGELVSDSNTTNPVAPKGIYYYNNANYIILGMVIEKLTGMTYAKAIETMILDPLGLTHTSIPADVAMPEPYASAYLINKDGVRTNATFLNDPSWGWSAGSMISTVDDQLKWLDILLKGSLLSEKMRAARLPVIDPDRGTGYGLGLFTFAYGRALGHNGNYNRLNTSFVFQYNGYDIIILSNGQAEGGNDGLSNADMLFRDINTTMGW